MTSRAAEVRIEDLDEARAGALRACLDRCYGDTYAEEALASARAIARSVREGRLLSKVAVVPGDRVVGHLGTRLSFAGDTVAETLAGVVDPDWRGRGLLRALGREMVEVYRRHRLSGIRLFATAAHTRTQGPILAAGGTPTGVLLAHIPAGTRYRGIAHAFGTARIASIVFHQPIGLAPALDVHPPDAYAELLTALYGALGLERRLRRDRSAVPPLGCLERDPRRDVSLLRLGAAADGEGGDLERLLDDPTAATSEVAYADVPLASPGAPAAVARLREAGFHLGALLPGSERSETLRLQRVADGVSAPDRIVSGGSSVTDCVAHVLGDRESVDAAPVS